MKLVLARIDDRFIHGQVTTGWGQKLRPDHIVLVSDEIASDPWQTTVYGSSVPPPMQVSILSVKAAAVHLAEGSGPLADARRVIVLTGRPSDMLALVVRGVALDRVNVGGMHHDAGKRELVPSVYIGPSDLAVFRDLVRRGIDVSVQAVPGARSIAVDAHLLEAAEKRW